MDPNKWLPNQASTCTNTSAVIRFFFHLTDQIKLYHWQTKNYARHIASDTLHATLLPLIDRFVETYSAAYDPDLKVSGDCIKTNVISLDDTDAASLVGRAIVFLSTELPMLCPEMPSDLINIRDEMVTALRQAQYLFRLK